MDVAKLPHDIVSKQCSKGLKGGFAMPSSGSNASVLSGAALQASTAHSVHHLVTSRGRGSLCPTAPIALAVQMVRGTLTLNWQCLQTAR